MNPDNPMTPNNDMSDVPVTAPMPTATMPEATPAPAMEAKAAAGSAIPMGPLLGVLLVVIVLALGALYVIGQMNDGEEVEEINDPLISEMNEQSTSTALSAIEEDLNATNMDAMDAELNAAFQDAEAQ